MTDERNTPQVLIEGPTAYGMFFIRDTDNRVWDGKSWRGFGQAEIYGTFQAAFADRKKAKAAINKAQRKTWRGR